MKRFRRFIPDLIILVVFIIASVIYFAPALEGKIIYASDNLQAIAASQQAREYLQDTGNSSWWQDSMFSGMPTYQVGGYKTLVSRILSPLFRFVRWGEQCAIFFLLFYLCAFYCLLRAFDVRKWLAMAGAFAMALSSYFLIIIAATHYGKPVSIVNMSLVLAGFVIIYKGKSSASYAWGGLMVALFTMLGFFNHPQMSYYLCMLIGVCWFAELARCIQSKSWKKFALATAVFIGSFGIGLATQATNYLSNREYQAQTMRGGHSDLQKDTTNANATTGLSLDYATAWSYGIDETMTLLIPEFEGGASGYNVGDKSLLYKELTQAGMSKKQAKSFCEGAPTYRGEKAFTSGAVYVGAIVCFLFLLGLLIVPGPYKWALLAATLFSVFLSWGRHFMPMTEFFFNYFPMYNKFRAVESILIVAEITIPLLGFLGLNTIANKQLDWKRTRLAICIAGGVTALICLITALAASAIDVTSTYDAQWKGQVGERIYEMILDQRTSMIRHSAWRSLLFVCIGFALTYGWGKYTSAQGNNLSSRHLDLYFGVLLTVFIIADMWPVDKKFCNDSLFRKPQERDKTFAIQDWEKEILQDDGYYRVLNLSTNTFNDARTSYRLNSIGGYSAAKLRRYQDLIDEHISQEINPLYQTIYATQGFSVPDPMVGADFPVLNMLNMKYVVVPASNNQKIVIENPYAMGAAWFVDDVLIAETPTDECNALQTIDLHTTAVIGKDMKELGLFSETVSSSVQQSDSFSETVCLVENDIAHKRYHAVTQTDRVAVFSEIYYPKGWKVYLDNQEVTHFRANYLLRAMLVPAGEHDILFVCDPDSVHTGNIISIIALILLFALIGCAVILTLRKQPLPNSLKEE